jgi:hypothetical protein
MVRATSGCAPRGSETATAPASRASSAARSTRVPGARKSDATAMWRRPSARKARTASPVAGGVRGADRQLVVAAPQPRQPGDGLVGERVRGAGGGQDERVQLAHPRPPQRLAQALVEHLQEARLQPEDRGDADLQAGVARGRLGHGLGHVDGGVERLGQQQRDDDDLVVPGLDQPVDDRLEARLGQIQERLLDPQVGAHRLDLGDQGGDGLGRPRVTTSVSQGHQGGSGHQRGLLSRVMGTGRRRCRAGIVVVMSGSRTRSCWSRPSARCAGPHRGRRAACTARTRWRGSRRRRAG